MKVYALHPGKLSLFLFLSLTDLFLTWRLLLQSHGQVYESNPIADWWLSNYGWSGLAAFKIAMALSVAVLATATATSAAGDSRRCVAAVLPLPRRLI